MSIEKRANTSNAFCSALNNPKNWEEINISIIKTASINKSEDIGNFDLKSAIKEYPEHLFVKIFAIKANEVNDNGDNFSTEELKKATSTFVGVPVFCNHQNDDIEKARGTVTHSWYDNEKDGIFIIARIDKVAYPKLARGIEEKIISGTSMGASVSASICSVCHNCAATAAEYCDHIQNRKNKKFSGKIKCQYHNSPHKLEDYEDKCPICGSIKNSAMDLVHKKADTFEHNYGVKFIEDSFVVNQACHSCVVNSILNVPEVQTKVAKLKELVTKLGVNQNECDIEKIAGQQEIQDLHEAMNKIERVAKSMMSQKEKVSMEYVSDLVEAMASVQSIADELVDMGYLQMPSPSIAETEETVPELGSSGKVMPNMGIGGGIPSTPIQPEPPAPVGVSSENFGNLGSVTLPKKSDINSKKIKEINTEVENGLWKKDFFAIRNRMSMLQSNVSLLEKSARNNISKEPEKMSEEKTKITTEKVASVDNPTDVITEKQMDKSDPVVVGTGERWGDGPEVITEKQLDKPTQNKNPNETTSESPQERRGTYDVITEKQMASVDSGYVTRWNDWPEVITEKQWTDVSRMIGSKLSESQENIISEKQLADFRTNHRFTQPVDVITEKQLDKDDLFSRPEHQRWAYSFDAKKTASAVMAAMADTIAYYGKTPNEIIKAAKTINNTVENKSKAAFLIAINSLPHKDEARKSEMDRMFYFSKLAASEIKAPGTIDSIIIALADNANNISADDLVEAISVVASNDKALEKIEKMASEKMVKNPEDYTHITKSAQLTDAIDDLDRPEDGLYQVNATIEEIGVDLNEKSAFLAATHKIAQKAINDNNVKIVVTAVDTNKDKGTVVATAKDISKLNEKEQKIYAQFLNPTFKDNQTEDFYSDILGGDEEFVEDPNDIQPLPPNAFSEVDEELSRSPKELMPVASTNAEKRNAMVKEAQMLGGEMGGGVGGGTTMPQPPAAVPGGAPVPGQPIESFETSDMETGIDESVEESLEPKPPGSFCGVCKSDDVDVLQGKTKCNNCGSTCTVKVLAEWDNFAGVTPSEKDTEIETEEFAEGEGFELPEGEEAPVEPMQAPIAAKTQNRVVKVALMSQLTPETMKKASDQGIKLGTVSPITGSENTLDLGKGKHICLDTGKLYTVAFAVNKKNPKNIYAQWEWDSGKIDNCNGCSRAKTIFVKALSEYGIEEDKFDALSLKEKGDTIVAMHEKGLLKESKKDANAILKGEKKIDKQSDTAINMYKKASVSLGKDFPIESCMEKLARRYGLHAVALSGPCEGQSLCECVCNSLKKADVYSHGLAIKVASIWGDKPGSIECIEDYVRLGFDLKKASTVCQGLKDKYAQFEDRFSEELGNVIDDLDEDEDVEVVEVEDFDPFDNEEEGIEEVEFGPETEEMAIEGPVEEGLGSTVTVELPIEVVEKIDEALDVALGENPEEESVLPGEDIEVTDEEIEAVEEGEITPEEASDVETTDIEEVTDGVVEDTVEDELSEDVEDCKFIKNKEGFGDGTEEEVEDQNRQFVEGTPAMANTELDMEKLASEQALMRPGNIGRTGRVNSMDLESVINYLNKSAADVKSRSAQEVAKDTIDFTGQSAIGGEEEFSADSPQIPDIGDKAKMGKEDPPKAEVADVFTGPAQIGEEELDSEISDVATGGDKGQGKHDRVVASNNYRDRLSSLAERVIEAQEKKVVRKQDQDEEEIKPYQDHSFIGKEEESIGAVPTPAVAKDQNVPTAGPDGGFIGKEKESLGPKPTEKDTPSIPAKDDRIGGEKDNEKLTPEHDNEMTGNQKVNVAASSSSKSKLRNEAAFRVAGRMLEKRMIKASELSTKVAELSRYEVEQLKDFEKNIFSGQKGLQTLSDGAEHPMVISEKSTAKENQKRAKIELTSKLEGMFSLSDRNAAADADDTIQLRKAYGR